ncbi:uncharacterized protein KY384_006944 [Bacidia gigantensis]|uniref:uncharacterized protein n=1 Tax=Bacidia gigantensis TaxID=2732470 RepID=UPI001D04209A|nr:uncharacterized protein KY384_006944 [Bacidia gigantensis]KAG8528028.1 hypothetical protein KY384_006944 [Bacidia gigantensis]
MSYDRPSTAPITTQSADKASVSPPYTARERFARRLPSEFVVPISGGISGAVAGLVSCPLDVIKTKLQAQGGFRRSRGGVEVTAAAYRGVAGSASTIWKEDGIRGMYRGLGPMLLGYIPTWAVYLTVYNKTQAFFRTKTDNWFIANVYASLSGGACSTLATNPIWVIKTRLMSQSSSREDKTHSKAPWHYRNTMDAARKMYLHEGILSFYSGLTPALLGLAHVAVQFPLYEVFKERFTGLGKGVNESAEDRSHHFYGLAGAVFLSKVCASTATYPHEVVRTRLQTQQRSSITPSANSLHRNGIAKASDRGKPPNLIPPAVQILQSKGTWQTCKIIYMEEGWRGFYAGLGTNLIRAVPSAMTTILTFEYLKKTFFYMQRDHDDPNGTRAAAVT